MAETKNVAIYLLLGALVACGFLGGSRAAAQPSCCVGSGCCGEFGEPCVLEYGASGVVRDAVSGLPIGGASVVVRDLTAVETDARGEYTTSGSRDDTCHIDYFFSIEARAEGYEPYRSELYSSHVLFSSLDIDLQPLAAEGYAVRGRVAEFPECAGAMRGVVVNLEPSGLSVESGLAGGEFEFVDVPPGEYVVTVPGCNPFGCWRDTPVEVVDDDVFVSVCMDEHVPTATPTPPVCAVATVPNCGFGERVSCGADPCVAGCECVPCDACPEGEELTGPGCACGTCPLPTPCVRGERPVEPCDAACGLGCGCEPDANSFTETPTFTASPPPTGTPTPCAVPTGLVCPHGERGVCDATYCSCECVACPECPEGEVKIGSESCQCDPCPVATPCVRGRRPVACFLECGLGCGCEDEPSRTDTESIGDPPGSSGGCAVARAPQPPASFALHAFVIGLLLAARARSAD